MAGLASAAAPVKHRSRGVVRINVALATDATADGGDIAATVIGAAFGELKAVMYNGGFDAAGTVTIRDFKTGAAVFGPYTFGTEGTPVYLLPTDIVTDNAGVDITAADTAPNVNRPIRVGGKLTVEVANGGVSESGVLALIIDESPRPLGDVALTV